MRFSESVTYFRSTGACSTGSQSTGVSLIELMMVLAIVAILASLAVPGFTNSRSRIELRGNTSALETNLAWARSEAVKRNRDLVLCPDGGELCADSTDWSNGWIGFVDMNRDRKRQLDEPVLLQQAPIDKLSISSSTGRKRVRFTPNGMAMGSNLTITLCHENRAIEGTQVIVSIIGRIRSRPAAQAACPENNI